MPNKVCPKCNASVHVRMATCTCGNVFYEKKKDKEEVLPIPTVVPAVVEVKEVQPKVYTKHVKDPIINLKEEATLFGYSLKEIDPNAKELKDSFRISKVFGYNRYEGIFNSSGKITGIICSS